jgi:hypothetical protein
MVTEGAVGVNGTLRLGVTVAVIGGVAQEERRRNTTRNEKIRRCDDMATSLNNLNIVPEFHVKIKLPSFTSNWRRILGKLPVLHYFRHHLDMNFTNIFCEAEYLVWETDPVKHPEANTGIFDYIFLRQAFFIHIFIWIFCRELHDNISCRSDNFPGKKNIFQTECLDLLPEF